MNLHPSVIDRLVFVKYLLRRGAGEAGRGHELAMAVAVLHFHDAMEIFFQCIADTIGIKDSKGITFTGYPAKIRDGAGKPMVRPGVVDKVNNLRVPLKHVGIRPRIAELRNLPADVEAFFEQNAREFLSVDLDAVSLGDMITDDTVRGLVKDAEKAIDASQYHDCFGKLGSAFDALVKAGEPSARLPLRSRYRTRLDDTLVESNDVPWLKDHKENSDLQRMVRGMNERYRRLVAAVEPLRLGLDAADYLHFRELTEDRNPLNHTGENASFCLNFVMDAALRMQEGGAPKIRDPWSRYTIEVEADSVPLRMMTTPGIVEERQVPKGERFEDAQMTIVASEGKPGPSGPHWRIGNFHPTRLWEDARFIPLDGVRIVEEKPRGQP